MVIKENEDYHSWGDGKMLVLAYTTIITIGGLVENTLVIFLFLYYKSLRTVTNNFIINLAACNLILAILELVFSLPSQFASDWIFGDLFAVLYAFSYFFMVSVSMVMLAVIAYDRYHVISRPKKLRVRISTAKSFLVILVVYIYTLAITSPIIYAPKGLEVKMYISGCYIDFEPTENFASGWYAIVISSLLFVIPLVTMVYYYWKIFQVLRRRRKSLVTARGKDKSTAEPREEAARAKIRQSITRVTRPASTYTKHNTPKKTLRLIATLVISFVLTWTPFHLVTLCRAFNEREIFSDQIKEIVVLLTKSVIILNPIAYALVNHRFQKCVAKLFCGTQGTLGVTTCTENSADCHFSRHNRGSTQESRRPKYPPRMPRLSSTPEVSAPGSFTPARKSTLRHSYSDSQLGKHARIEECLEEPGTERQCRKNTDHDRFLKMSARESRKPDHWDIHITSF